MADLFVLSCPPTFFALAENLQLTHGFTTHTHTRVPIPGKGRSEKNQKILKNPIDYDNVVIL